LGPDKPCANVCTHDGRQLSWVKELRYLGIFIVSSRNFECSLDHAKRSFYRAANSIFGKIGRIASEDVLIELLKTKVWIASSLFNFRLRACNSSAILATLNFRLTLVGIDVEGS